MKFSAYLKGIEKLYATRDAELALGRPATAAAIERLERKYGFELPEELRNALQTTNGIPEEKAFFGRPGFLSTYSLLSVSGMLEERQAMRRRAPTYGDYVESRPRDRRIAPGWYCDGWLPFAGFGGGTLLLLVDASPTGRGTPGQVIAYTHDPDEMTYVASSFERFLAASLKTARSDPDEFLGIYE
jgi:cell wall assembly regulator SMI1